MNVFELLGLKITDFPISEPNGKVGEGETIVGYLTNEERTIFFAYVELRKRLASIEEKLCKPCNREALAAEKNAIIKKIEILYDLFWGAIRTRLNLWNNSCMGIREGCKVVTFTPTPEPESQPFCGFGIIIEEKP